jgi:hypothetical protein
MSKHPAEIELAKLTDDYGVTMPANCPGLKQPHVSAVYDNSTIRMQCDGPLPAVLVAIQAGAKLARYRGDTPLPSYEQLVVALIDAIDGHDKHDIVGNTGMSIDRAAEILHIRDLALLADLHS